MKKILACAALLLALVQLAWSAGEEGLPLRRLAMYVGSNNGGPGRVSLRYAEEDARSMAGVMQELGGIAAGDSLVLLAPTSEDVLDGLQTVRHRVQAVRSGSRRIEFLLYYSGHSDEQGLLLGGELLEYSRLKSSLQEVQADVNIAILDSCSSGAFTRLKGGTRQPPFLLDESSQMQGHAFISSSSADEAAQESDRVNGSFFTHFLISGLRGAADSTRDGQVSLNEAYYFAFNETLSRTQHTQGGAQHPSYNIQLTGSGDLTLTDLRAAACAVRLDEGLEGRLFVRDGRGRLMVELRKERDVLVDLGLPEGRYELTLERGGRLLVSSLGLRPGAVAVLGARQFTAAPREPTQTRGEEEPVEPYAGESEEPGQVEEGQEEVDRVPFAFSVLPFLSTAGPGRHEVNFSLNLLVGGHYAIRGAEFGSILNLTGHEVRGVQYAGVGNILDGALFGVQSAGVFNIVGGRASFLQSAGVFNIDAGPFYGLQAAGVFNVVGAKVAGVQAAGVFNHASGVAGVQIGVVNIAAGDVNGAQVGVVNIASGDVRGTQIGVVNLSRQVYGLPVGLVNLAQRGGVQGSLWVTDDLLGYAGFQMSSGLMYTLLYCGTELKAVPSLLAAGLGFGLRVQVGRFFVDTDLSAQHVFQGDPSGWGEGLVTAPLSPVFPTLRLLVGLKVLGPLALFAGVALDTRIPDLTVETPLHTGTPLDLRLGSGHLLMYPKLFAGLRL